MGYGIFFTKDSPDDPFSFLLPDGGFYSVFSVTYTGMQADVLISCSLAPFHECSNVLS